MISLLTVLAGLAQAQDLGGLDAHGFKLTSLTPSPTAPIRVYQPQTFDRGDFYVGLVGEFAKEPLVLLRGEPQEFRDQQDALDNQQDALDNLLAFNLGVGVAVHQRVRVELGLPVYGFYTRDEGVTSLRPWPGLGDIRLAAQVVFIRREADQDGLSLGLAPFLDLPTGMPDQFLGQDGMAGGGRLAGSHAMGRLVVGADAGVLARPGTAAALNLNNPLAIEAGLHGGVLLTDRVGLNLETTSSLPLASNVKPGTESPVELTGTLHGVQDSDLTWLIGGSTALSKGAGAADWRGFVGVGWGGGPSPLEPLPVVDAAEEGAISIQVLLDGRRVANAPVDLDGARPVELVSAVDPVLYEHLAPGDVYSASVTQGPCMAGTGQATVVANETTPLVVELEQSLSAQVRLEIYDADDKPLKGGIVTWEREVQNCVPGEPLLLKQSHTGRQSVGVGKHTVFVTVEGYNTFVETVNLKEGDDELIIIKLAPTKVQLTEGKIEILEKVYFDFDGDEIEGRSADLLDEVAAVLRRNPDIAQVEVGGHTDEKGPDQYNLDLSQRRVESVRAYLIDAGVGPDRLVAKGYGESEPIASNANAEGRAENRRVEFTILARTEAEDGAIIRMEDGDGPSQDQIDSGKD